MIGSYVHVARRGTLRPGIFGVRGALGRCPGPDRRCPWCPWWQYPGRRRPGRPGRAVPGRVVLGRVLALVQRLPHRRRVAAALATAARSPAPVPPAAARAPGALYWGRHHRPVRAAQRGRQAAARKMRSAPTSTAACQGVPVMIAWPADPETTNDAAARRAACRRPGRAGDGRGLGRGDLGRRHRDDGRGGDGGHDRGPGARPEQREQDAGDPAECTPWWRSPRPGRPARRARGRARRLSGTRSLPDTLTTCGLSGFGGVNTACAHRCLTARMTSPAPTAPVSSANPYSRLGVMRQ